MVSFLGSLVHIRLGAAATGGQLAILEHHGERGYGSPVHRHQADEETFLILDGELRFEVDGHTRTVGAGSVAFLPRQLTHAFVVTSAQARFLTLHTPAGFDEFTAAAGTVVDPLLAAVPADLPHPGPAEFAALAKNYGIEILGPPPRP